MGIEHIGLLLLTNNASKARIRISLITGINISLKGGTLSNINSGSAIHPHFQHSHNGLQHTGWLNQLAESELYTTHYCIFKYLPSWPVRKGFGDYSKEFDEVLN